MRNSDKAGSRAIRAAISGVMALAVPVPVLAADPVVSNVSASQRAGTELVDIAYDVADSDSAAITVSVQISTNNGAGYDLPATNFNGAGYGAGVTPGTGKQIVWNAGADWNRNVSTQAWFRVLANDGPPLSGFVLIPAGSFTMGDTYSEGNPDELPTHQVTIGAFYMESTEVTKAKWDDVHAWAISNGYVFDNAGLGKASSHPVHTVNWHDAVKWCNARSEKDGLTPCYHTSPAQTSLYRAGTTNIASDCVKWTANGYRLPTEAEWEKAARGGGAGRRFPWLDADTITHSRANYCSSADDSYDVSPTRGYHPAYWTGAKPYSSPVGSFSANGHGLHDMLGNMWELCWDRYDNSWYSNAGATQADTRGPSAGTDRVIRGGGWGDYARNSRTAIRSFVGPDYEHYDSGFRCVRGQAGTGSAVCGPVTLNTSEIGGSCIFNDYDGDGVSDLAVYDPVAGMWYITDAAGHWTHFGIHWGGPGLTPVPGDCNGDGKSDLAVYGEAGGNWYITDVNGTWSSFGMIWGGPGLGPVSGDYDGDGQSDLAVYHQATGCWYITDVNGRWNLFGMPWGGAGLNPVCGDYDGDGISDLAVYSPTTGHWYITDPAGRWNYFGIPWGGEGLTPVSGDYDGDGISDLAVYSSSTGYWYITDPAGRWNYFGIPWGGPGLPAVGAAW